MLSTEQITGAQKLLEKRPAVLPGTRAILDQAQAKQWYDEVCAAKATLAVPDSEWWAFCDLAGVAD